MLRTLFRNPLTLYLRFVLERALNRRRFHNFDQGYMSQVTGCVIGAHVRVQSHATVLDSRLGAYTYVASRARISRTEVGNFCSIAPGCRIGLGTHPAREFVSTSPVFFSTEKHCGTTFVNSSAFEEKAPVVIGNDVWIGVNAVICDGVKIGDGAIIGAGAVVVADVPDYAIYGGVPARLIRFRFTPEQIKWLQQFAWWDRDEEWLRSNAHSFDNISTLVAQCGPQEIQL